MDLHQNLQRWFHEMGYNGNIPEDLSSICNNSTRHIWEQFMENARPKQEVEYIRKNIVLNRLKLKPLEAQEDYCNPIKEIKFYKEQLKLKQKITTLNEEVQRKYHKVQELSNSFKLKEVSLDTLKRNKINLLERRKFLLERKRNQLEAKVLKAKEMLAHLMSITPAGQNQEFLPGNDLKGVLLENTCKLERLLLETQQSLNIGKKHEPFSSKKKLMPANSSIATLLLTEEKKNFEQITQTCQKLRNPDGNNMHKYEHGKVKNRLFQAPLASNKDVRSKLNFEHSGIQPLFANTTSSPLCNQNNRESLGLLPVGYLDQVNDSENFLQITDKSLMGNSAVSSAMNDINMSTTSFKVPQNKSKKSNISSLTERFKSKIYNNREISNAVEKILLNNNKILINHELQNCISNLTSEFNKVTVAESEVAVEKSKVTDLDIAKLKFVHVKKEFEILRQKKIIKELILKVSENKTLLLNSIQSRSNRVDLEESLEMKLKQVTLDASLVAVKKVVSTAKLVDIETTDFASLTTKITKVKEDITNQRELIQWTMGEMRRNYEEMLYNRESIRNKIYKFCSLTTNAEWMNLLREGLCYKELITFEKFPLEYRSNRTEAVSFNQGSLKKREVAMMLEIFDNVFTRPETVIFNILKTKFLLQQFRLLRERQLANPFFKEVFKKYSLEELNQQESYASHVLDRFRSLINTSTALKTLSVNAEVKQSLEFWMQLPHLKIISTKRMLEEHDFQYYKRKLDEYK